MLASKKKYTDIVRLLLDKDANTNLQDSDRETALMIASSYGKYRNCKNSSQERC